MTRDWNIIDDGPPPEPAPPGDEDRLNHNRIRLIVADRRDLHRRQQWALAMTACYLIAASAMAMEAAGLLRGRSHLSWAIALLGAAFFLIFRSLGSYRRWRETRVASASAEADTPSAVPQFDQLSAGRQHLRNLEAIDQRRE